jgi:hypothetical protein
MKKLLLLLITVFLVVPSTAQRIEFACQVNEAVNKLQLGDDFNKSLLNSKIKYIINDRSFQKVYYEKIEANEKFTKHYFWIDIDNDYPYLYRHVFICVSKKTNRVISIYSRTNEEYIPNGI